MARADELATPQWASTQRWAGEHGLPADEMSARELHDLVTPLAETLARLDELAATVEDDAHRSRPTATVPTSAENPHSAWRWKCSIDGTANGPLSGMTMAVKDTIAVGGVPLSAGSKLLENYVPHRDSTVVARILAAGGKVKGTTVCESFALSANSHTSDHGPVTNPHDTTRSSGGSSNGSAVVVATGEVDAAVGGDQGGSVRIPASWTGIVGLKPTYGLIPCTGTFPFEPTVDHVGLLARSVKDVAAMLQAVAGPDGLDGRSIRHPPADGYLAALDDELPTLRIGVVSEGFGWPSSDTRVDSVVRAAIEALPEDLFSVESVSIPLHRDGPAISAGVSVQGFAHTVFEASRSAGWHHEHLPGLSQLLRERVAGDPVALPDSVARYLALANYLDEHHGERYYHLGRLLGRQLTRAYDRALEGFDVLCMPTTPTPAQAIPERTDRVTAIARASEPIVNTCASNVTGHPSISVPCGDIDGLPVGLMLIARRGADDLALRGAYEIANIHAPTATGL